jgi:prefoldin subunit 2
MAAEPKSEQEVLAQFQQLVEEREQLTNASIERQQEVAEHDLVIKTLAPLDADRKCFRLVGEVLVERTVADVLPAVKKNRENLSTVSRKMPGMHHTPCGWHFGLVYLAVDLHLSLAAALAFPCPAAGDHV